MATRKPPPPGKKQAAEPDPARARDIKAKKVQWVWHDRIPRGQIVVVAGPPDMGKGLFVVLLTSHMTKQLGEAVIHSAVEDSPEHMTRPRLEAAGADLSKVHLPRPFALPKEWDVLAGLIVKHKVKLVILDPLTAHLSSGVSRRSDSIRELTTPMQMLANKTGTTFVLVEHTVKNVARDAHPLSAIGGGSSGLVAAARMGFLFGKDPKDEDRTILACVKHNLRDKPLAYEFESEVVEVGIAGETPYLIPLGECEFDPLKLLRSDKKGKQGRNPEKRAEAEEWLVGHLATHGKLKGSRILEDAKQFGLAQKTVRRAADSIGIIKAPTSGPNVQWDLPAELKQLMSGGSSDGK